MNVATRIGDLARQIAIVLVEILAIGTEILKISVKGGAAVAVFGAEKLDEVLDEIQGSLKKE